MARKKSIPPVNSPAAASVSVEAGPPPKILEYTPNLSAEKWRVERFDALAAQFQLSAPWEAAMKEFHDHCAVHTQTSAWLITRRLFGILPLIPTGDVQPDDLRASTREELCASLGCKPEQITAELDFLGTGWRSVRSSEFGVRSSEIGDRRPAEAAPTPRGELALDDGLLERFGFSDRLFKISIYDPAAGEDKKGADVPRSERENRLERAWFCSKLRAPEWQKMLEEPLASAIARETLVNELYLHRLQDEMMPLSPSSKKFKQLSEERQRIESQYQTQLEKLQEKFPEMAIADKLGTLAVISDLNLAHREFYGNKDNRRWNGVNTAGEVEFLLRTSAQLPSARFDLGWTVAVVEAINGLYNPDFRSKLKKRDLKKLTEGFREGVAKAKAELNEPAVDLEKGVLPGEGDEFPDYGPEGEPVAAKEAMA